MTTREQLIEAMAQYAYDREGNVRYVWADMPSIGRQSRLDEMAAIFSDIEASGFCIVPLDSTAATGAVLAAIVRSEPSWVVWREGVEAAKL